MGARLSRLGLLITLVLAISAGPGVAQRSTAREHLQLVLWHDDRQDPLLQPIHDLIWLYQQYHPDVLIHLHIKPPSEAYRQLQDWSGPHIATAPDMVIVPTQWLQEFGSAFRPVGSLLPAQRRGAFYPAVLDMLKDGRYSRALPWSVAARALLVRTDLLEQADLDPPTTWDEVQQVAAQVHDPPDVYGFGLPGYGGASQLFAEIIWALGGSLNEETGASIIEGAPAAEALDLYCQLTRCAQPEVLSWSQAELEQLFAQGQVAMMVSDTWMAHSLNRNEPELKFETCPLPAQTEPVGHLLGEGLAIFKNSEHMQSCLEFAQMICQDECQEQLLELGGVPTTVTLAQKYRSAPLIGPLISTLPRAHSLNGRQVAQLQELLAGALYWALSGRTSSAEALQAVQPDQTPVTSPPSISSTDISEGK